MKLAIISYLISNYPVEPGKSKINKEDIKTIYPHSHQTYWNRSTIAKELTSELKTALAKGFYDDKNLEQLKEEYVETINLGVD